MNIDEVPDFNCMVCGQDMSHMHEDARHIHVNGCLDRKKRKSLLFRSPDDSDDNIFDVKPKKHLINTKPTKSKTTSSSSAKTKKSTQPMRSPPVPKLNPTKIEATKQKTSISISEIDDQLSQYRLHIAELDAKIAEIQADKVNVVKTIRKLHQKQQQLQAPLETTETTHVTHITSRIFKRHILPPASTALSSSLFWTLNQQSGDFDSAVGEILAVDLLVAPRTANSDGTSASADNRIEKVQYENSAATEHASLMSQFISALDEAALSPAIDSTSVSARLEQIFGQLADCVHNLPCEQPQLRKELLAICERGSCLVQRLNDAEVKDVDECEFVLNKTVENHVVANHEPEKCGNFEEQSFTAEDDMLPPSDVALLKRTGKTYDICKSNVMCLATSSKFSSGSPLREANVCSESQSSTVSQEPIRGFDFDLSSLIACSPPQQISVSDDVSLSSGRKRAKYSLCDVLQSREMSPSLSQQTKTSQSSAIDFLAQTNNNSCEYNEEEYIYHYSPSNICEDEEPASTPVLTAISADADSPLPSPLDTYNDETIQLPSESLSDKENNENCCATTSNIANSRYDCDLLAYDSDIALVQLSTSSLRVLCTNYGLKTTNRDVMLTVLRALWRRMKASQMIAEDMDVENITMKEQSAKKKLLVTADHVTEFIKSQKDIFEKIVTFDPIDAGEIQRRMALQGLPITTNALKEILDSAGVFVIASRQDVS